MVDPRIARSLGPLEAEVMAILWDLSSASVRLVTMRLNAARPERPLAYTTVMTVMSRLAEKGFLSRTLRGKTYEYAAVRSQSEFLALLSNQRVTAVVEEFGELALSQFLGHLEQLGPDSLRRLVELARQQSEREQP
ncbi:MAG: BlaI/MecI/CopY family transcriptional regulator [Dehalococcoidia bacterium]